MKAQHICDKDTPKYKNKKIWGTAALLLVFVLLSGIVVTNIVLAVTQSPVSDTLICITQDSALAQNGGSLTGINISNNAADKVDISDSSNIWSTTAQVDIFKHNDNAVKSNGTGNVDNVIAPGTSNDYTFSLQNSKDFDVKYTLNITGGNDTAYEIPVQLQILNNAGTSLSGDWTDLADFTEVNDLGTISPNNENQYTIRWKWDFENGADDYDTFLGNTAVNEEISCHININVIAEYDTATDTDSDTSTDTTTSTDSDTPSQTPSTPSSNTSSSSPITEIIDLVTTGDRRNVALIIGVFSVCAVTMIVLMVMKKKSKDD